MKDKDVEFLQRPFNSKHEFQQKLIENYSEDSKCRDLYLIGLRELHKAVEEGNLQVFKHTHDVILRLRSILKESTVLSAMSDDRNPLILTNLVILACKYNKFTILKELFKDHYWHLSSLFGRSDLPETADSLGNDAMYYALRTGNMGLIRFLIEEWPEGIFEENPWKLEGLISKGFEKLTNRNVSLPEEVHFYVVEKLMILRFISESKEEGCAVVESSKGILKRVDFLDEQVSLLQRECWSGFNNFSHFLLRSCLKE